MDYHQTTTHGFDLETRRLHPAGRDSSAGGALFLLAFLLAALALVIWLTGSGVNSDQAADLPQDGLAEPLASAPILVAPAAE